MTIELGNKGIPLGSYEEGSGGSGAGIDDKKISESTTWSSNKINTAVTEVSAELVQTQGDVASLDADVSTLNNVVGNHTTSISAINDSIGVINNTMVTKNQMNALEERVATLEAQAGGAAPTVTFSNEGEVEKAGAATSSNTLQSEDIGSVIFDTSGSAEIK